VDEFFYFCKKSWKNCFQALVGITWVKDTSVIKKETKKDGSGYYSRDQFWYHFLPKIQSKTDAKTDVEKT
jgi:hypothetical protein